MDRNVKFDTDFAAKGIVLDRWCGVLVKIDAKKNVVRAYAGTTRLTNEQIKAST
jgi:hypothetical protein